MRILSVVAVAFLGLATIARAQNFDTPVHKQVVDLGASPYYTPAQHVRVELSCFYYPNFLVKQLDSHQKGADSLSIVPLSGTPNLPCSKTQTKSEIAIDWDGYFKGVKGSSVFFDASDGTNGGLPFGVFDAKTGKKLFEDSAYTATMWTEKTARFPLDELAVNPLPDGAIELRYLRVVGTECDLRHETGECWENAKRTYHLPPDTPLPTCIHYDEITDRLASSLAYPIETVLSPQPVTKNIPGPLLCWPVD